jgi:tetratricopeptide (TPR) repeat protein
VINSLKVIIFYLAAVWFFAYCVMTSRPAPAVLCLGFFIIIPVTLLQSTWLLACYMNKLGLQLLLQKQYVLAQRCARCGSGLAGWWANIFKLTGTQNPAVSGIFLGNLLVLADSAFMNKQLDEAIAVRKQMVEVASAVDYQCSAAKSCDFLAFLFKKQKDKVHARHWAERALAYYNKLSNATCACGKGHEELLGKHAALYAQLALDSQDEGFINAADGAARKAVELIDKCDLSKAEVALMRLMNYYYKNKNWDDFVPVADRYKQLQFADDQKSSIYMLALTHRRLGLIYTVQGQRDQAEASARTGIECARRANRPELVAKLESDLANLHNNLDIKVQVDDEGPSETLS